MVHAGLSPLDAIRAATIEGARLLGADDRLGSLAVGKDADLLIVEGNPLNKIADLERATAVIKAGTLEWIDGRPVFEDVVDDVDPVPAGPYPPGTST